MASEDGKFNNEDKEAEGYKNIKNSKDIFTNRTSKELQEFYDSNAIYYEKEFILKLGIAGFYFGSNELAKHLKEINCPKDVKIADVGAGTGLVGYFLKKEHCYTNITAFDISPGMLEYAKMKDAYIDFILCDFNEGNLETYYQQFDHAISTGCFVLGNLKPNALDKIARIVKSGGFVCISYSDDQLEDEELGYKQKLEELEAKCIWKEISRVLDLYSYKSIPEEDIYPVYSYYVVYRVC